MELSEGKLFTIEALNRIEGFEWPELAQFATVSLGEKAICFYKQNPLRLTVGFDLQHAIYDAGEQYLPDQHPDWKNSLITRAEFESVDGWVRNDLRLIPDCAYEKQVDFVDPECVVWIDYDATMLDWTGSSDGGYVVKWRYHKPQKQAKQPTPQPATSIESLISQHKAAKQSTLEARRLLEHAEAIEHNLLLSIEVWAESNGFYIRELGEVQEVPELVITDWRDLRIGDVICLDSSYRPDQEWRVSYIDKGITLRSGECGFYPVCEKSDTFKFIRRPAKGEK